MPERYDADYKRALEYYRAKAMLLGMDYLPMFHAFQDSAAVHHYLRLYHADTLEEVSDVPRRGLLWHINAGQLPPEVTNPNKESQIEEA